MALFASDLDKLDIHFEETDQHWAACKLVTESKEAQNQLKYCWRYASMHAGAS